MHDKRQKLRDRYKLGFDRLAVVAMCLFAIPFGLMALAANDPYALPADGTSERQAIEAAVSGECVEDQIDALALLCRERVLSDYRWAHYRAALARDGLGWLYGALLALLVVAAAVPAVRWVVAGFRRPQLPDFDRPDPDDRRSG